MYFSLTRLYNGQYTSKKKGQLHVNQDKFVPFKDVFQHLQASNYNERRELF